MLNGSVPKLRRLLLVGFMTVPLSASMLYGQQAKEKPPGAAVHMTAVSPRSNVDMLDTIERSGKLRVGVYESVPWTMRNKHGDLIGFEIDVANRLAKDLGVTAEFHPSEFRYLIPDLLGNRFDIIIADFSIDVSRAPKVNFSRPYDITDVALVENSTLASGLKTLDSFNQPSVRIGVIQGATSEALAATQFPKASIQTYTEERTLLDDLVHGKLTAAAADKPRLEILTELYPDAVSFPPISPLGTYPAAFAVRRGDMGFVNFLDSWIYARSADRWLEGRRAYWFGTREWAGDL